MTYTADLVDVLRAEGPNQPFSDEPLFLVHAMGGTTGCYKALTARLPPGQPIYAFKAPRAGHPLYPLDSVEAMGEAYAAAAGEIAKGRPVHLAGWSMGGLVALHMARTICAAGGEVGSVSLIDTWMRREQLEPVWSREHRRTLERRRWRVFFKLATGAVGLLEDDDHPFWSLGDDDRMAFVLDAARIQNPDRYGGADGSERLAADHEFYLVLRRASDDHRPQPWPKPATVRAAWIGAEGAADLESANLWAELIPGGLTCLMRPGDHLSIVDEPHVAGLADALVQVMTEAGPAEA